MKIRIGAVVLACALGACGGKQGSTTAAAPPSPCRNMASHITGVIQAEEAAMLAAEDWPKVAAVLEERCTNDGWAADTVACMQATVHGKDFDDCADKLPDEQEAAVKEQFEATIKPLIREDLLQEEKEAGESAGDPTMEGGGGGPKTGSPPPPPGDPCGGDE